MSSSTFVWILFAIVCVWGWSLDRADQVRFAEFEKKCVGRGGHVEKVLANRGYCLAGKKPEVLEEFK